MEPNHTESDAGFPQDRAADPFAALFESVAFAEFDQAIDRGLEQMVSRWSRWAAPNATAIRRPRRPGKKRAPK